MAEYDNFYKALGQESAASFGFSDQLKPDHTFLLSDGTKRQVMVSHPTGIATDHQRGLTLVVAKDTAPDGTTQWHVGGFESEHPDSFQTSKEKEVEFFEPLHQSLKPVNPADIQQALIGYFSLSVAEIRSPQLIGS